MPQKISQESIDECLSLYRSGNSLDKISKLTNLSKSAVHVRLIRILGPLKKTIQISKERLVELVSLGLSLKEIGKLENVSQKFLNRIFSQYQIDKPKNTWTLKPSHEKSLKICLLYKSGMTIREISEKLSSSKNIVLNCLRRYKVPRREAKDRSYRKHQLKIDFFEKIDTEEKAYFLGFIYADGNLSKNQAQISISLQNIDFYILERMANLIYSSDPTFYKCGSNSTGFSFFDKKIYKDLLNFGLHPNKSLTLTFPTNLIENEFLNHFIRGYFDGDGSTHLAFQKKGRKSAKFIADFLGTKEFLNQLSEIIRKECGLDLKFYATSSKVFMLRSASIEGAKTLYNYMYRNATMFLTRKKEKFELFFKIKEDEKNKYL